MQNSSALHHFTTGLCIPTENAKRMLNSIQHGQNEYCTFRHERFINRENKLSATIKKVNSPKFQAKPPVLAVAASESISACKKRLGNTQHLFDIARSRDIPTRDILRHELTNDNILFDGMYLQKPDKASLAAASEEVLQPNDYII